MEKNKRIDDIDILKAIGIILMILGHIGFGEIFDVWKASFHMPIFFLASGFLYKKSSFKFADFFKKKFKALIVPYISFGFLHYLIWFFINISNADKVDMKKPLINLFTFNNRDLPISGALWFLTALFFLEIVYYVLDNLDDKIKYFIIFSLSLFGCFITSFLRLPLSLDISFMALGLFECGRQFKSQFYDFGKAYSIIYTIIFTVIGSILSFVNGLIIVREGIYNNVLIYYLVALMMTYSMFNISHMLGKISKNWIYNELLFIGKNSIVYLCINQIVLLPMNSFISQLSFMPYKALAKVFSFFICMIIIHLITHILNNRNLKWLIGR